MICKYTLDTASVCQVKELFYKYLLYWSLIRACNSPFSLTIYTVGIFPYLFRLNIEWYILFPSYLNWCYANRNTNLTQLIWSSRPIIIVLPCLIVISNLYCSVMVRSNCSLRVSNLCKLSHPSSGDKESRDLNKLPAWTALCWQASVHWGNWFLPNTRQVN